MNRKIGIISLGCAKNLVNTEQMMHLLSEEGFEVTGETEGAGVVLVNTCGFIDSAKAEAIETLLELGGMKAEGRISKIVVAGCLPELYRDEILAELPEIDAAVGTGAFGDIADVIKSLYDGSGTLVCFKDIDAPVSETGRIITTSPVWAYLKIAEGCDNRCAYCVIPSIRGRFRSRPTENIVNEAKSLAARGVRELIIVAQDVTMYGRDLYGKRSLTELLGKLCEIDGIEWIRLHYLYPDEIDDALIDFIAKHDKILKYLDIPIQHINDAILSTMNRRGSGGSLRSLFSRLRERIPGVVLRTSVITGLPGEGEEEYEELCQFLLEARIERAGIFPYSPQEGTAAALMAKPDPDIAAARAQQLADMQSGVMDGYDRSRIGSVVTVLIEGTQEDGAFYGRSFAESPDVDGYITVSGAGAAVHEFVRVRIASAADGVLEGVVEN